MGRCIEEKISEIFKEKYRIRFIKDLVEFKGRFKTL